MVHLHWLDHPHRQRPFARQRHCRRLLPTRRRTFHPLHHALCSHPRRSPHSPRYHNRSRRQHQHSILHHQDRHHPAHLHGFIQRHSGRKRLVHLRRQLHHHPL